MNNQAHHLLDTLEAAPDVGSAISTLTSLCKELLRLQEATSDDLTASQVKGGQEYPREDVKAVEAILGILEPIIRNKVADEIESSTYTIPRGTNGLDRRFTRDGEVALSIKRQAARIARGEKTPERTSREHH